MADGPQDYRDPKVTATDRGSSMKWLWYVLGALLVLLLLAWLLGLFDANDEEAVVTTDTTTEEAVIVEEPVTDDATIVEPAAD